MRSTRRTWIAIGALAALAPQASLSSEAAAHGAPAGHATPAGHAASSGHAASAAPAGHGAHAVAPGPAPAAALKDLLDGNKRFVAAKPAGKDLGRGRRHVLAGGQHPKAIVLSCSDSRVPPELLFDQGLGDLFVVRLAGNVADPAAIGSVEYAAGHLGTRLVVVLGHHSCGAVKAALAGGEPEGNLGAIVNDIAPAVSAARRTASGAELEHEAVHANARHAARALVRRSELLRRLVAEDEVRIAVAVYDLETGTIELDGGPEARGEAAPTASADGGGRAARPVLH